MTLDYQTMVFFLGYISLVTVILFTSFFLISRTYNKYLITFAVSRLLQTVGIFGIALRNTLPTVFSVEISNVFILFGIALEVFSVSCYKGKTNNRLFYVFMGIASISSVLFVVFAGQLFVRYCISVVGTTLPTIIVAIQLIRERKQFRFPLLMAGSYLLYGAGRLMGPIAIWFNNNDIGFSSFPPIDGISLFISTFSIISAIGFLFLLKEVESFEIDAKNKLVNTLLDQIPVAIIQTDLYAVVLYVNPQFSLLTGYMPEDIIGKKIQILKSGKTPIETYVSLWKTIETGEIWYGQFINKKKDNTLYIEESTVAPLTDYNGNIVSYLAIASDITERQKQEELIKEKNAQLTELNASKNKLFSVIAHDLRSPLGNVPNLLELVQHHIKNTQNDKALYILDVLIVNSNSTFQLLENLLHWSRTQLNSIHMQPSSFLINEVIEDIIDLFSVNIRQKKITVSRKSLVDILVYADIDAIRTVLRNLLSNAIKFSPERSEIQILTSVEADSVTILVRDYGIGIAAEKITNLFKLSENESTEGTNGEKGTGLGLVIASDFVLKNNGRIWVESSLENGATFFFSLPKRSPSDNELL